MSDIQHALNSVWAGYVDHYSFDLLNHCIEFYIRVTDNGNVSRHKLVFGNVASFYFIEGLGAERFNRPDPDEGDSVEFTSVRYFPNGIGEISLSPIGSWKNGYPGVPNFAIEMWNTMLFIECASMVLDEVMFQIGYATEN